MTCTLPSSLLLFLILVPSPTLVPISNTVWKGMKWIGTRGWNLREGDRNRDLIYSPYLEYKGEYKGK